MPIFTVYAKLPRKTKSIYTTQNTPILTIYEAPLDYSDLKQTLLEAARTLHNDHESDITEVTLERHLPGKYIRATTSYRETRIRYKRQFEFKARITYLKSKDEIKINCVAFGPLTWPFKEDYYQDANKKWKMPNVVPTGFEALLHNPSPDMLYQELTMIKTPTYMQQPKNLYGSRPQKTKQHSPYAATPMGMYAGRNYQTIEKDKQQKQNQIG